MATHSLQIEIGAALSGSFGATMSSGMSQLTKLGSTIKQLESSSKNIGQFQNLKQSTLTAKNEWAQAEAQVKSLAQQMNQAGPGATKLANSFEQSKNAAAKAKQAYLEKRNALHSLGAKLKQSGIDMNSLSSVQTKLGSSIDKLKTKYRELGSIMQQRQAVLSQRANLRGQIMDTIALGAAMAAPIKAAVDFESAMADVKKVVDFKEQDGLIKLGNTIREMSRDIPISAEGLAQITAAGGQLGVKEKDLAAFTETVSKMSTAFDMLPEEAGQAMAQLSNVFQIPMQNMSDLGDAINHLSNNMASKAKDIIPALNRVGGSVRQFGLEADQAAALVATLISMGQMPEKAGTAVSAMLMRLQTAEKQGQKFNMALKAIGLSASDLTKKIGEDAQGAIIMFFEAMQKVDKQKRAGILVDIFGKNYQKDAALITESLDAYRSSVELITDKTKYAGSMQKEFANRAATTANNFQLLKNTLVETGINLGETLLPAVNSVVDSIRKMTEGIANFAKEHPLLTKGIIGITTALVGCKVAGLALGYAWTFIKGGILAVMTIWKTVSLAFATNTVGVVVAALAGAALLIITNWTKVKEFFSTIWEKIQPIWEKFAEFVKGFWNTISAPFKAIGKAWNWITNQAGRNEDDEAKEEEVIEKSKDKKAIKTIKEAAGEPLKNITPIHSNKTQNNNFTINISGKDVSDPEAIKTEIEKMLESRDSGALYDFVSEAY
jgi:TP901 family phage tail tape measure protein